MDGFSYRAPNCAPLRFAILIVLIRVCVFLQVLGPAKRLIFDWLVIEIQNNSDLP
jgi:hypothetical protein